MTGKHSYTLESSKPAAHISTYGRYIGRVGALAAALGIGVMVVTAPGVATADPSSSTGDTSSSSSDAAGASSAAADAAATEAAPTRGLQIQRPTRRRILPLQLLPR